MHTSRHIILAAFTSILIEHLGIDAAEITPQAYISDVHVPELQRNEHTSLGADSLDIIEIGMSVETEFGFDLDDDEAAKLHTVQDWISHIASSVA
jgi:acyl carrier protein